MVHFNKIAAVAAIGAASYASASPVESQEAIESRTFGLIWNAFEQQAWGWQCIAPWLHASLPSFQWNCNAPGIPAWTGGDKAKCWLFWNWGSQFCQQGNQPKPLPSTCKPPTNGSGGPVCQSGYQQVYSNYQTKAASGVYEGKTVGAATIDNANYLTYLLVTDTASCLKACDQTNGCAFVNIYQDNAAQASDVNELPQSAQSKYTKGNLTCALYKACSGTDKATNYGGQQDPTFITDSSAYCKSGKC